MARCRQRETTHAANCGVDAASCGKRGPRSVSFRRMRTVTLTRNQRALAWALGIMALLAAVAVTRHHLEMIDHSPGGHYLTWRHAIHQEAPDYVFWALAIPIVYLVVDRVARRRWGWPRTLLAHAMFALAVVFLVIAVRTVWFGAKDMRTIMFSMLPAQLRPHFVFNALNSVAMLVRGGRGTEAVDTIARVSELLRDGLSEETLA